MVELIGDICAPKELIAPHPAGVETVANAPTMSGAIFVSGATICAYTGASYVTLG